jgi:TolA-binding protein
MAKQKKMAYGIAEDGSSLKLAYLIKDGQQVSLQALEQVELEQSLYQHPSETAGEGAGKPEGWKPEGDASGEIVLDDINVDSLSTFRTQPYDKLLQTYNLNQGVIAVNIFDEQIIKLPISTPDLSHKQQAKLVKENIPASEFKDRQWQSSAVSINDQAELWIHHGTNRLLEILETAQKNQKTKYYFQLADANETALANLFMTTMTTESNERNMILYLGKEFRRALIFEGHKWTFSLPIFISQQPDIDVIYSKLSLALDEAHIVDPDNLYVCGDNCYLDSVEYLRTQLPNSNVEMWHLNNLYLDSDVAQLYDADLVARFMLPIALAWKALTFDGPTTLKSNFLPSYVTESQKVFKIAWHGYLAFALLFLAALFFTFTIKQLNFDIKYQIALSKSLTKEFTYKKQQADEMLAKQRAIEQQKENINVMKTLLTNKNPWTEIVTRLNNSFLTHPTSWITNLRKEGEGFKIMGVTTSRPNIVYFSNLFPNGSIINAKYRKIRSFTVWDFEINYSYPEVDWYKMMEVDAENLRKYQEERRSSTLGIGIPDSVVITQPNKANLAQKAGQIVKGVKQQDEQVTFAASQINIPYPAKKLIENGKDPSVYAYKDIVTAFNAKNDWLMVDQGVKFVNNYPKSPLVSYVRWYLAFRAWQNKQYDKGLIWLTPLSNNRDATYPYTLLLSGMIQKNLENKKSADTIWRKLISDYPQHPTAATARRLLNEK